MRWLFIVAGEMVVPLALLLFAQWPLRDWVQAYSRQANDAAQILFAVYAAVAITAASRSKSHLAPAEYAHAATKKIASWRAWALLACVGPWAFFMLWTAAPQMLASITSLEKFSEGLTPGYFILRIALVLLAVLVLIEAIATARASLRGRKKP